MARLACQLASALTITLAICHGAHPAERVQLESARYQVGPLQRRLALERREPLIQPPAGIVDAFLTKPDGPGPFPAIVHLHGCSGLPDDVKRGANSLWSEHLVAWGYAVLVVDSFTTRGIGNTCLGQSAPRVADAYGALAWLARQPFVDASRIAVIGFSAGGSAVLSLAQAHDFELFEGEGERAFKAAVAFYPYCVPGNMMKMPMLVLIGELDDWTPAALCRGIEARRSEGNPVKLVLYPGAYHSFDSPRPGRRYFGHWLEYNAAAAEQAKEEVRAFLARHMAP
jgi:dienelactone hydrolase